jgi:hypothetical protein
MKKINFIILFLCFVFNSIASDNLAIDKKNDTSIEIEQIEFSQNHTGFVTYDDLLINYYFKLIFDSSGKVTLTWPFKCPVQIGEREIICAYNGNISKSKFNQLARYLIRIDFKNLKDRYIQDMDDVGYHIYLIKYNGIEKKIFDENYEVDVLKKLRKKLIKLKNEIKWTPVVD